MRRQGVIRRFRLVLDALLVLLILSVVGGVAWMSRQPDAALFERLASTPMLGSPVRWLRSYYLPAEPGREPDPTPTGSGRRGRAVSRAADAPSELEPAPEAVWIGIGAALHDLPERSGAPLGLTVELRNYPVLERRGSWVLVPIGRGREAWGRSLRRARQDATPGERASAGDSGRRPVPRS